MHKSIAFWTVTSIFSAAMFASGVGDLVGAAPIVEGMAHLGYPAWFPTILGAWKVAGVLAILAPGLPRVKEWAYAGFAFALSGAFASHLLAGDPAGALVSPTVLLGVGLASYALRPAGPSVVGAAAVAAR